MKNVILLFPGQGSQQPGMGKDLYENFPEARRVFDEADGVLGESLSGLCFGDDAALNLTANTQPAILTHSMAVWETIRGMGFNVVAAAGHSLGEYSALCAAGVIPFKDAVRAVRERGDAMQSAVPEGVGGMAAILGLDAEKIRTICADPAFGGKISVANYNSPEQTVITGALPELDLVCERMSAEGASKTVRLPVSAPFHSPLIEPAARRMEEVLGGIEFSDPSFPVYRNVDIKSSTRGSDYRPKLVEQVCGSVRWVETITELAQLPHDFAIEVGPGKVLMGLGRRITRQMKIVPVGDTASIQKLREML